MNVLKYFINIKHLSLYLAGLMLISNTSMANMKMDSVHVTNWNNFFSNVYGYHLYQMSQFDVYTKQSSGGYSGQPNFYQQIEYYNKETHQLLSRIQWETNVPDQIHVIEVYVYDNNQKLKTDYLIAFLPEFRNAPIQTLINVHYKSDALHSYRQFDASGAKIYEQCQGQFFSEKVFISLMDDDFVSIEPDTIKTMNSEAYLSCFEHLPMRVNNYINPLKGLTISTAIAKKAGIQRIDTHSDSNNDLYQQIKLLSKKIQTSKNPVNLYIKRGKIYFKTHQFELASADYTTALKIDNSLYEAYFGRGMSLARQGKISQGIDDLSKYIQHKPNSSIAYTKRGVRYIWLGDLDSAEKDLKHAIQIKPNNSEAHDDLGVLYARKGDYRAAIRQFLQVIKYDPIYQKGYHNLALSYHIIGQYQAALKAINRALNISNNEKNSLLLKAEILMKSNMEQEAKTIIEQAEFLPEGNWSERFSIQ